MPEGKKSFVVYCSQIAALNELSDAQIGKLIRYLVQFLQSGREPSKRESNALLVAFNLFKLQISIDLGKYEKTKARVYSWRKNKQVLRNVTSDNVNVYDNDYVNVNEDGENKNNKIDFYSSLPNSEEEKQEEEKQRHLKWFETKVMPWWNRRMEGSNIPSLRRPSLARAKLAANVLRKFKPEEVEEVLHKVSRSDYMNGRTREKRLATFNFVFTEENFVKIMEGEYR